MGQRRLLVLGNMNAVTYKDVWPLVQGDKMWLGVTHFNTGMYFGVPDDYQHASTYKFEREIDGQRVMRVPGICWLTNLDHGKRHQRLDLTERYEQ